MGTGLRGTQDDDTDWPHFAFVMTDIVASTQQWEQHTERMADNLALHDSLVTAELDREGRKVHGTGDGFLYVFDDVSQALDAALATQDALKQGPWRTSALSARVGVSYGPAQPRDDDFFGPTVNRCARVMSAAHGGQILIAEDVVEALRTGVPEEASNGRYPLFDHGLCHLKDLGAPVRLFELTQLDLEPVAPQTLDRFRTNLPQRLSSFVGRRADVQSIELAIAEHRLVTLTGPGGAGKTRLALEIAASQLDADHDGVWFVPFEQITDGAGAADLVARSMGVRPVDGLDTLPRLVSALRGGRHLAVLDCCEHVLDQVRAIVNELLDAHLDLVFLVTSRQRLTMEGEFVWQVGPLEAPRPSDHDQTSNPLGEAAQLFIERAGPGSTRVDPSIPAERAAIAQIVYQLQGMPLAIELAAARIGALAPSELLDRLDHPPPRSSQSTRPARHQTLEATIEWSDRLLSPAAQVMLRRLTVFSSPPTLQALEFVTGEGLETPPEDIVDELVGASLLTAKRGPFGTRFTMFDTVASYAAIRLDPVDGDATIGRHAEWTLQQSRQLGPMVQVDLTSVQLLRSIQPDLEAGNAWFFESGHPDKAAEMAANLAVFWVITGQAARGRSALERALESNPDESPNEAATLEGAGIAAALDADYPRSDELLTASATVYRGLGRTRRAAYPEFWRSRNRIVQAFHGGSTEDGLRAATRLVEHCISVFRDSGDLFGLVLSLPYLAWARMLQGSPTAREPLEEALQLAANPGLERVEAYANAHLAHLAIVLDDNTDQARQLMSQSMGVLREAGDRQNILICQLLMTAIELRDGDIDGARRSLAEAADIATGGGSREWERAVVTLGLAVAASSRELVRATQLAGLLDRELPTWRHVLANTGLGPNLDEIQATLDGTSDTVRRAAARSGTNRSVIETIEMIAKLEDRT